MVEPNEDHSIHSVLSHESPAARMQQACELARRHGIKELSLCGVNFFDIGGKRYRLCPNRPKRKLFDPAACAACDKFFLVHNLQHHTYSFDMGNPCDLTVTYLLCLGCKPLFSDGNPLVTLSANDRSLLLCPRSCHPRHRCQRWARDLLHYVWHWRDSLFPPLVPDLHLLLLKTMAQCLLHDACI